MNPFTGQFALRLGGSILTGILLALCYPRIEWTGWVWVGLIPLILIVRDCKGREALGYGWISGLVFFGVSLQWLGTVTWGGVFILTMYCGFYFALWAVGVRLLWRGHRILSSAANIRFALSGACAWVVLEWFRGHLLTGFPWNELGTALYSNLPMIQTADLAGVYGISFLIVFTNIIMLMTVLRLRAEIQMMIHERESFQITRLRPHLDFFLGVVLLMGVYGYGLQKLFERPGGEVVTLKTALIQGNIAQDMKWDKARFDHILSVYGGLTESAAWIKPDLIIWPESATPSGFLENREVFERVNTLSRDHEFSLIFGSNDTVALLDYTGAFHLTPGGEAMEYYYKMHLVPYGEYVPLRRFMPWMRKIVPIGDGFTPGTEPKIFVLPQSRLRLAPLICFEDIFSYLARQRALQGAHAFVNLTNGGWYGESAGVYQHLANAIFRSVETRRPTIRATNTGITCWIDAKGAIRDRFPPFVEGFVVCEVSIAAGELPQTFYTRHGDVFVLICWIIITLALAGKISWPRK